MRRASTTIAIVIAVLMVMAFPATAADLHDPHAGTYCPEGYVGTWHFVNNQTGGEEDPGTLVATFDGGKRIAIVGAEKVNRNVQHFYVDDYGNTLDDAYTDLDGRLVLSDYECRRVKK